MEKLTEKQKRVLRYIEQEITRCNYPPSVRDICRALNIRSTATVHAYLDILENKGYISRMASKPRAITLLRDPEGSPEMKCSFAPIVGSITAGQPILAEENREGFFPVPAELSSGDNLFVLKVSGESMIGAGIGNGDYVIVRQQDTAENGEITAVLIDNEATVKRFYRESGAFRLQPENSAYQPIITDQAEILGKVIGLFRRL